MKFAARRHVCAIKMDLQTQSEMLLAKCNRRCDEIVQPGPRQLKTQARLTETRLGGRAAAAGGDWYQPGPHHSEDAHQKLKLVCPALWLWL